MLKYSNDIGNKRCKGKSAIPIEPYVSNQVGSDQFSIPSNLSLSLSLLILLVQLTEASGTDGGAGRHASLDLGVRFLSLTAIGPGGRRTRHARERVRHGLATLQHLLDGVVVLALIGQVRDRFDLFRE